MQSSRRPTTVGAATIEVRLRGVAILQETTEIVWGDTSGSGAWQVVGKRPNPLFHEASGFSSS